MISKLIIMIFISLRLVDSQLIRSNDVYVNVVRSVCDHYECDSVTLIYTGFNYTLPQEITVSTELINLQLQLNTFHIQTILIDLKSLAPVLKKYGIFSNIRKSVFVFLSDSDDLKAHFSKVLNPQVVPLTPMWLMFSKNNMKIDDYLKNVYIPFNSKFMISKRSDINPDFEVVTEVYQITPGGKLRSDLFALWSPKFGAHLPNSTLYKRRNNLHGHLFRVTALHSPPTSIVTRRRDNTIELTGICGKVMELLMKTMNFTVTYKQVATFGSILSNKTWTGAVGSLISNDSDIFAGMLRMTIDRNEVVDFPMATYLEKFSIFMKKSSKILTWDKYLKPFKKRMWMVICSFIIIISIIVTFIKSLNPSQHSNGRGIKNVLHVFGDTSFAVFGVLCNQAMEESHINSIRIVQFITHMTGYVVIAAYSAVLISSLTVYTFNPPFTNLRGLLKSQSYRFGVVRESSDYTFFQTSLNWILKSVYEKKLLKETSLPANPIEGLKQVCNEKKYVFMTAEIIASHFYQKDCSLMPLQVVLTASMGIGLQQNSHFHDLFNAQLLSLRENGLLTKSIVESRHFINDNDESWSPVQLVDIFPLLVMLIGGGFLSILIMCCEIFVNQKPVKRLKHLIFRRFY